MKKSHPFFFFLLSFFFLFQSCEKNTTPLLSRQPQVSLTVEEVTCTEAWLRLTVTEKPEGANFQLLRGDSVVQQGELLAADTLLYDDGLLPNRTYAYKALLLKDKKQIATSDERTVTTMDTTSHNFQWQTFEFPSPYGSASLYDVAIINENDIWAVGEIYADSAQPWLPYNAMHWDGSQWELKRITVKLNYGGGNIITTDADPIKTIYRSFDGYIWFVSVSGGVTVYHGNKWDYLIIPYGEGPGGANGIWGITSSDLYFVGTNGNITYYNGSSWQKLESGTTTNINDIWGKTDCRTGKTTILCTVSDRHQEGEYRLLSISGNTVRDTLNWPYQRRLYGVWFDKYTPVYIVGSGVYKYQNNEWENIPLPNFFTTRVRGTAVNNLFVVGAFGMVSHFNGAKWFTYSQLSLSLGSYEGLAVKDNLMVATGLDHHQGIILMGRRTN